MASRIRGAVASSTFDNFHKHSARLIRLAVMGRDTSPSCGGDNSVTPKKTLRFPQNKFVALMDRVTSTNGVL